jgi:DNA polymerase sigma
MSGQKRNTPSLPPPVRLDLTDLDGQLLQLAERLAPSVEQRQRQRQAWGSVQGLLQALWPDAGVHLFGSGANELDIGGSNDLDVCLELEGVEETKEARGGWVGVAGTLCRQWGVDAVENAAGRDA